MRKLFILRTCINFVFYLSGFAVCIIVLWIPFAVLGYTPEIAFELQNQKILIDGWASKLLLITSGISSVIFFYSIYLLRKNINYFVKKDLFNAEVIRNFNTIGKCIIFSSLLIAIASLVYTAITGQTNGDNIKIEFGFDSPLLSISLGLFFMVLSEVFKIAKNLKDENDLTL